MTCSTQNKSEYQQRDPSNQLLYQIVRDYYPRFKALCEQDGKGLPQYVQDEFEAYLKCGQLYFGFIRRQCEDCQHPHLLAFSCKKRGFCGSCCGRRAAENVVRLVDHTLPVRPYRQWVVTLPINLRYLAAHNKKLQSAFDKIIRESIHEHYHQKARESGHKNPQAGSVAFLQRFGTALNLNLHWHCLVLDGSYTKNSKGEPVWHRSTDPDDKDVEKVLTAIRNRFVKLLQKEGLLNEELELVHLPEDELHEISPSLAAANKASITQYIALGERAGLPVRKIGRSMGYMEQEPKFTGKLCAELNGFTIHAATHTKAWDRKGLENLVSYMTRPPVAQNRLSQREDGLLQYDFKRAYSDGTKAIVLSPLEMIEKLAALVPPPFFNMVRYGGVFAPNSELRSQIVKDPEQAVDEEELNAEKPKTHIPWSKLLARVFNLDMDKCPKCGGRMKTISEINEREVIDKILNHLGLSTDPPDIPIGSNHQEYLFDS